MAAILPVSSLSICFLVFPVFGAAAGAVAVMPLAFILTVTAIKDGVEDYGRAVLDEEVNTSASTKLGNWRNVNQPQDARAWWEKLFGLNAPGRVSKGVRKLRDREAGEAGAGVRIVLNRNTDSDQSSISTNREDPSGRRLEDIQSVDSHSYPPGQSVTSLGESSTTTRVPASDFGSMSKYQQSLNSHSSVAVIDNKRTAGSARWERTLWKKLEVGDIVLLRDNDQVPADIVVLSTSDPDGMCYLETKNLDGETNLKPRRSVKATMGISSEEDVERSSFYLDSEPPHQNLYLYHGILRYKDASTGEKTNEPVSINSLLLRGCMLRNTQWVVGLVAFTGADTKIMLNGGATPSKRSKIEKETNFNVIVNFVVLSAMCIIAAIFYGLWNGDSDTSGAIYEKGTDPTNTIILNSLVTLVYVILFSLRAFYD